MYSDRGRATGTGRDCMQLVGLRTIIVTGLYYVEGEREDPLYVAALRCAMNGMTRNYEGKMAAARKREMKISGTVI